MSSGLIYSYIFRMRGYVFAIDSSFWKNMEVPWEVLCFGICPFQCIGHFGGGGATGVLELSVLWNIAVYSIDWAQKTAGLCKISNHPLVSLMVSASQRLLGRPKAKKDPATVNVERPRGIQDYR